MLARVIERAQWLAGVDVLLRQKLPSTLAGQVTLANVDDNHLVLLVASPVWKAKLRQHVHELEDAAAAAGLPGRTVLVKVSPDCGALPTAAPNGKPLSAEARLSLRATAQSISDPELAAQLMRLANLP